MSEGITVGDAVLQFLGDTTRLDTAFAQVGPNAEAAFQPAAKAAEEFGDAAEDAGQRTQTSMREARGEVALLGEEFGVHLPRHVRSFIAELPGVGEAMSAAFSATAILFVAQAIAQVAEKLSKLTADYLIYTESLKAAETGAAAHGAAMEKLKATYDADSEAIERFGKTALQLAAMNVAKLTAALEKSKEATAKLKTEVIKLAEPSIWDKVLSGADKLFVGYGYGAKQAEKAAFDFAQAQATVADRIKQSEADTENKHREQGQAKREFDAEALKTFQAHILALNEADNARTELYGKQMELQNEAENARSALDKKLSTEHIQQVEKENEADTARTKLYQSQVALENEAENARFELQKKVDDQEVKYAEEDEKLAEAAKKRLADLKKDTSVTFQSLAAQWKEAAEPLKQLGEEGQEAFNKLTSGLQSAVAASILSSASFGQAMEQMTRQVLAGISAQAAVKALYYAAEGTAMLFTPGMQASAAGYFTAAGEMAAIALVSGVTAHEMPGSGSSGSGSSNTEQSHSSGSSTGQSNRSGGSLVGVQGFAEGGLIAAPILAMVGEGYKREAILPLDDDRAMASIREGLSGGAGGGVTVHVHGHVIGASDVAHLTKEISKQVNKGKANLTSSNSLRLTKRSA